MIFNITSALNKTSCTDYVDFGKNAEQFVRISWFQIEKDNQKYLDIQLKVFRKDDKRDFRRHQQIKFLISNNFSVCGTQLIMLLEFSTDETLREVVTSPLSKDLDEQLKHVQKAITIVDGRKRKIFASMKKYFIDKPESTYVQLRHFTRNSEHDKFQQLVFVNYKYDDFLCLLDVITSISDQVLSNQSLCNIVYFRLFLSNHFLNRECRDELEHWR